MTGVPTKISADLKAMAVRIYGNREIKTLPGEATRPTSARVREALFNIWQSRIRGCRWLDLCAGSGAMGAEALCRGAADVIGIEKSGAACRIITQNWQKVAKSDQTFRVIQGDVVRQLAYLAGDLSKQPVEGRFDYVYFDPPYAGELYGSVLEQLLECLSPSGVAAVEYNASLWQPTQLPPGLEVSKEKRYGSTNLVFLQRTTL